jgi:hypothetical protein
MSQAIASPTSRPAEGSGLTGNTRGLRVL